MNLLILRRLEAVRDEFQSAVENDGDLEEMEKALNKLQEAVEYTNFDLFTGGIGTEEEIQNITKRLQTPKKIYFLYKLLSFQNKI